jgi:CelD/BcsL family acetyltransferase involved in cellulose biosynthesis
VYTYQSGIDPDRLEVSPGRLAHMLTIRRAVEDGYQRIDFLRGDEPYKAHWRASAQPIYDCRVFPNRPLARLQGHVMSAAIAVKDWMKQGVESVTS